MALSALRAYDVTPVSDERIARCADDGTVVTAAGVSAGIDLALWLTAQIAGPTRAEAIPLAIEYDPQPPFDTGHRSKAAAKTVVSSTLLLSRDALKPGPLAAGTRLMCDRALAKARRGR